MIPFDLNTPVGTDTRVVSIMVDIGGIITRLAPLIEKPVTDEYNLWANSKTKAQNLSSNLKEIQKVLEEAERRRLTDPRVKAWLQRLQDATYEIDDALDEWETTTHLLQIQELGDDDDDGGGGGVEAWLTKISIFIHSLCLRFQHIHRRRGIAFNIKELNAKIELIANETGKYSSLLPIHNDSLDIKCEITTSFSQLVVLKGQENEKDKIVDQLMTCRELKGDIQVISLVGMTGIGKTTLAQLAFHDPRVENSFERRSWVCLSHTCDEVRVAKAILQSLDISYGGDADLQKLLKLLHSFVSGKRLLLVLDNVWIENDSFWRQLKGSIIYGKALECIILVTSRNENVAKSIGSTQIIQVKCLSESDSWSLFEQLAFRGRGKRERKIFESIGHRIVKDKCEGLPIAVKTLGCYLHSRYNKQLWDDVLEKELWQLEDVAKALFSTFVFSYNELPLVVKQCYSYCALFQKGYRIDVDELIRRWMLQGYLISSDGADDDMEVKGIDYFEKLAMRSFFQYVTKDDEKLEHSCMMHSIVHDFAQYILKTTGSKVEEVRNLYIDDDHELSPNQLSSFSKSVRVLHFQSTKHEVPSEIGDLIHLRYLNLRMHPMKELPKTICDLYNLHTLDLRECWQISKLPEEIHKLRNLRHLLLSRTASLETVPKGVGKLTALRTLDEFKVGKGRSKLRYLANLNQLRGMICLDIRELNKEEDVDDAKKAQLSKKTYISHLKLVLNEREEVGMDVLEALQPPPNLQYLRLKCFKGTQCPSWFNGSCLNNLTILSFKSCKNMFQLPPLGTLPFLEELEFFHLESLERVGVEFLGITQENNTRENNPSLFPKLKKLYFQDCSSWQEWEEWEDNEYEQGSNSIMPCLQELSIIRCANLKRLPRFIPHNIEPAYE